MYKEDCYFLKFYGKVEVFQIFCRYREKCLQLFKSSKEIESAQCNRPDKLSEEYAMIYVERSIKNIPDKFWTSKNCMNCSKEIGRGK